MDIYGGRRISMKKRIWLIPAMILCVTLAFPFIGSAVVSTSDAKVDSAPPVALDDVQNVTDYSKPGNWLTADISGSKPVDVFYLYPSAYQKVSTEESNYCAVDNVSMIKGANGAFNRQATAFLPVGNIFAPYYRQADATYILGMPSIEQQDEAVRIIPAADAIAAFDYYIDHFNNGRPFILAGHSQGSNVLMFILSEIKDQPDVYERMIAAYLIGFSVTEDYLKQNPPLKFATGPDDTGVIISYNTEAEGVTKNPVVRPGALAINPISWKVTGPEAPKESNLGSTTLITVALSDLTPVKNIASAQVDATRGVVVCKSVDAERYTIPGWPTGVYHTYDYPFYFYNIRDNAQNRVDRYMDAHPQ
jgi:hypothetical protein